MTFLQAKDIGTYILWPDHPSADPDSTKRPTRSSRRNVVARCCTDKRSLPGACNSDGKSSSSFRGAVFPAMTFLLCGGKSPPLDAR